MGHFKSSGDTRQLLPHRPASQWHPKPIGHETFPFPPPHPCNPYENQDCPHKETSPEDGSPLRSASLKSQLLGELSGLRHFEGYCNAYLYSTTQPVIQGVAAEEMTLASEKNNSAPLSDRLNLRQLVKLQFQRAHSTGETHSDSRKLGQQMTWTERPCETQ